MEKDIKKIVNTLKQQAELFLLDAEEFYPFGAYINIANKIIPVGAYSENDRPSSSEVIDLLEKAFKDHIQKGDCKLGALAIDVTIKENNKVYDAIEMRFFKTNKEVYKKYFKYEVKENSVAFFDT
jgi:hypothetical protein